MFSSLKLQQTLQISFNYSNSRKLFLLRKKQYWNFGAYYYREVCELKIEQVCQTLENKEKSYFIYYSYRFKHRFASSGIGKKNLNFLHARLWNESRVAEIEYRPFELRVAPPLSRHLVGPITRNLMENVVVTWRQRRDGNGILMYRIRNDPICLPRSFTRILYMSTPRNRLVFTPFRSRTTFPQIVSIPLIEYISIHQRLRTMSAPLPWRDLIVGFTELTWQ